MKTLKIRTAKGYVYMYQFGSDIGFIEVNV